MKKQLLKSALIVVVGVVSFAGVASATGNWTDGDCINGICEYAGGKITPFDAVYSGSPLATFTGNQTQSWTFNLDNWVDGGWDINSEDWITKAKIGIDIYDIDLGSETTNREKITITADYLFGSWSFTTTSLNPSLDDFYKDVNLFGIISLMDHELILTIQNKLVGGTYGTFDVNIAGLYGEYCDITPIPEPATMLLFGTGILGLAGVARRRKVI